MCFLWSPRALLQRLFRTRPVRMDPTFTSSPVSRKSGTGARCELYLNEDRDFRQNQPLSAGGTPRGHEVFFDLETTGLNVSGCDIVQLSAISGDKIFNVYMVPRCPMTEGASRITDLTTNGHKLFLHGQPVSTVHIKEALKRFLTFLKMFNKPLLVGHNCKRFDSPILRRVLQEFHLLDEFHATVSGFLDTLLLSRQMFSLPKYTQSYLVQRFLHKSYRAHDATEDTKALQDLYRAWEPSTELLKKNTFLL